MTARILSGSGLAITHSAPFRSGNLESVIMDSVVAKTYLADEAFIERTQIRMLEAQRRDTDPALPTNAKDCALDEIFANASNVSSGISLPIAEGDSQCDKSLSTAACTTPPSAE